MCLGSRTMPVTCRCRRKVTGRFFLITVRGVTETIATPIEALGGIGAAWPRTGKRIVAARMVDAATEVTRAFMVNSLLLFNGGRGKIDSLSGTIAPLSHDTAPCESRVLVVRHDVGSEHSTIARLPRVRLAYSLLCGQAREQNGGWGHASSSYFSDFPRPTRGKGPRSLLAGTRGAHDIGSLSTVQRSVGSAEPQQPEATLSVAPISRM